MRSPQVYLNVLTVSAPVPIILAHPQSVQAKIGGSVRLDVKALGEGLSYQWLKNGNIISSAQSNFYSIQKVELSDQGEYSVSVSNSSGRSLVSQKATVSISGSTLTLIKNLTPQEVEAGGVAQFDLTAQGGSGQYSYFWYKDGTFLKSTSYPFYRMTGVQKRDEGLYHSVVRDGQNQVTSQKVRLTIKEALKPLTIVQNLTSLKVRSGERAKFDIKVEGGTGNYTYFWYKNGSPLKDTSYPFYNMSMVDKDDEGVYHGVVKDGVSEVSLEGHSLFKKKPTQQNRVTRLTWIKGICAHNTCLIAIVISRWIIIMTFV